MADVVVDAKPKEQLPYDPNDIPEAVRKRAAAVNALYGQSNGSGDSPSPETPEPPPPVSAPAAQVPVPDASSEPIPVVPSPAPAASPPPSSEDDNAQSWKDRYIRMQGRYNASQKTLAEVQEQMAYLGNELMSVQQQRPQQPPVQDPPPTYVTDQDVQNYGSDLLDFTQRAATQAIAPHLQALNQQNAELQRRLAQEARYRMDQAVELAIPNYREIDRDPRWHNWLLGIDVYAKRVRQQLLNEAIATADAPRVIQFFKGFLNEEAATGHIEPAPSSQPATTPPRTESALNLATLAAPGRTRPATGSDTSSVPPEKPLYTRAQLRQLYEQHRKGAFIGREAEWQRIDADIIAAGREGRVRT
jgi:hypothetical protein